MGFLQGYIAVSEVGRIAIGSSKSELPLNIEKTLARKHTISKQTHALVTHATSGEKPSM